MDKKYRKYSVEDFSQDPKFISWVKKGINQKEWKAFINENPDLLNDIETARKIIEALRMGEATVSDTEVYTVWRNIELFYRLNHRSSRNVRLKKIMRYAAVFLVALMIGATIPLIYFANNKPQYTELDLSSTGLNEGKLILAGGQEIKLKDKQSDIQLNAKGDQIKINQDSVIHHPVGIGQNEMAQIIVPFGRRTDIQLSDGTKVWLNAGSQLIFPQRFTGKNRKVFIQGEAYFEVAKDKTKPFIVETKDLNVTVLGTKFNLRANESDNNMEVVLAEGAVSLKANTILNLLNKEIKLKPNQRAIYNKASNTTSVESNVDVSYYTSWKEGLLEFKRESILNVFKQLARYYNVRFVTERNVELNRKISGKLDLKDSLDKVMKVVSDAAPINYRIEKDEVFVTSRMEYLPMK